MHFNIDCPEKFWSHVDVQGADDCWLWKEATTNGGYGVCNYNGVKQYSHRIAYKLEKDDPGKLFVCHKCDTPACVNPNHLFSGTCKDNTQDMISKERGLLGVKNGMSKLTEKDVIQIRKYREQGMSYGSIAKLYKVHPPAIYKIVKRIHWKHIN